MKSQQFMVSSLRFNTLLFRWYKKHGRHSLPWRKTRDPYRVLVSEVMLQQTQVERVLPKYRLFLRRFPTVRSLAAAPLSDVLRAWSGLGYNRRAKFLYECAKRLMANGKGRMAGRGARWPRAFSELLKLPGVGPSTAAAISSFSFGADEPMIDTNIRRVIVRVFLKNVRRSKFDVQSKQMQDPSLRGLAVARTRQSYNNVPGDNAIYAFAKTLIPRGRGREWNWAMMDVGALLCKAKGHEGTCLFQKLHGSVTDFVYKKPQKKFAGSNRYYRGRILAMLAAHRKGLPAAALRRALELSRKKFASIIAALIRESLIQKSAGRLQLPYCFL